VEKFANGSAGNGLTYHAFRSMLEKFLNKFYEKHQLPRQEYIKIQKDQEVMFQFSCSGYN